TGRACMKTRGRGERRGAGEDARRRTGTRGDDAAWPRRDVAALPRLARGARMFPDGAVPVRLRTLRPEPLSDRVAAPQWLANRTDLGRGDAVACGLQCPCHLHQRIPDLAG